MYLIEQGVGPFRVGDVPLAFSVLSIEDDEGNIVALDAVTSVDAELVGTDGLPVPLTAAVVDDTIALDWGTESPFTAAGLHTLYVTLHTATGSAQVEPLSVVVEPAQLDGWHTLASARRDWRDAPSDDGHLHAVLTTAREQCEAYAPALVDDEGLPLAVPIRYRLAQIMQARNVWNASKTDPASGGIGPDGFVIRPFPMDWTVKNILRPKNAVPVIA